MNDRLTIIMDDITWTNHQEQEYEIYYQHFYGVSVIYQVIIIQLSLLEPV